MKSLTWNQVNAWRLAQHGLSPRLPRGEFIEAASRVYGIHAQVMSAAELALWARVDGLTPADVQAALWQDRTLVKTWAMRGTLHLLAADDLPLYAAARRVDPRTWRAFFEKEGISQAQREAFFEAVPEILGGEPMTREQLAAAVVERIGLVELGELIAAGGWGTPLKPSAFRGDLCFGPNDGRSVTFVNPRKWIGKWEAVDPDAAFQEIARRYLRAYGPLTPRNFARWWNEGGVEIGKKVFKQIEDELEPVEIEGRQALALRSTLEPMQESAVSDVIRLLPMFDVYVLDIGRAGEPILSKEHWKKVFRPQGWITAVVLVDGIIKGIWDYKTKGAQTTVMVEMFEPPPAPIRKGIEGEAERLGVFLGGQVVVEYA